MSIPLIVVTFPSSILQIFEKYDVLCRRKWERPRSDFPLKARYYCPRISLHVPTYSEPPAIVRRTLDKLSKLDYSNYEVIVIDNNTKDKKLWAPIQKYCKKLGENFRFIHVDNLKGAKGGALNLALQYTDPAAEIVGVIDADYQADRQFLKALVGYFENPKMGFVQTPHDYRNWKKNLFLTMCYWEYRLFFHTTLLALNEQDAALTVGTMCLIRKKALQEAGKWSEWCVTEDSELAIRIHDRGYTSVYVDKTYGRGLIPDTFEGYKKQRYRWTAGPVQEFQHHGKHLLGMTKKKSKLSLLQKIYHLNHGVENALIALNIPLLIIGLLTIISMVLHHEIIHVPFELWLGTTIVLIAGIILDFFVYQKVVQADWKAIIGKNIASKALNHTITYSAFRTFLTGNAVWNRTSKFKSTHSYKAALFSTKEETIIGLSLMTFVIFVIKIFPYPGLTFMFLIGVGYKSLDYLAAPLMAMVSVWSQKNILFNKKYNKQQK